jgi:transcriptional regulator of acetoin/glycerol metabolism
MKLNEYYWPGNVRELQHTIEKAVILSDSDTLQPGDFIFKPSSKNTDAGLATFEEMEKQMIESALEKNNGQHSAVARQLGISRQTLYNKIKRYGI